MSSSSERTRKKAVKEIYNELATNVRNNHSVAPVKNNGYVYNSVGITRYDGAPQNPNQTAISNYRSYEERMELKKGKQFSNTPINGTEHLKYDSRTGNLLQIKYNSDSYHSPLVATGDLDVSGGKIMKNDFIPYGEIIDYPGFITDYSSNIFKTTGIGTPDNQQQIWIRNLTSIQHTGSHHWNKLNSQEDMTGFSLKSPILLWTAFDLNITTQSNISGYIINGTHRKGIIKNEINPVLYYDVYDHINFNISGNFSLTIYHDKSRNNPVSIDIDVEEKKIAWNPKQKGIYYYDIYAIIIGKSHDYYSNTLYDTTGPTITGGTAIPTPTTNTTPSYTFTSNESGTFTVTRDSNDMNLSQPTGGPSYTIIADQNTTITFDNLNPDTYDNVIITVTDGQNNQATLTIPSFVIDTIDTPMPNPAYVHIVQSNGNKYVFNDSITTTPTYVSNEVYTLSTGTYRFYNIAYGHPMAILNDSQSTNISYAPVSNSSDPIIIKVSGGNNSATNGDYYTFQDSTNTQIYIGDGSFRFMRGKTYKFEAYGISTSHPFNIYMSGAYQNNNGISGTGNYITITIPSDHSTAAGTLFYQCHNHSGMKKDLSLLYKSVTGTTADASYDFFYGDIDVTVNGDFGQVSIYCYYHGYMGGENLLKYTI